jgi:exosortase/archaeosortase family protein
MISSGSSTKNIIILFVKTLSIYAILSVFFYGYVGILDPRGDYYSPFLAKISLLKIILNALVYPIMGILELLGYDAVQNGNNVSIAHEKGILIYHACLGIDIMIAYVSLILGFPGKHKIKYLLLGLIFIHVLNIVRMMSILLTIKTNPSFIDVAHDLFNYIGYASIIALFYYWVTNHSHFSKKT